MSRRLHLEQGFTLIELLMAMAVFSFMLLIIITGMFNVLHMRSQALASNKVQDSARTAMNELVRAVRDSAGVVGTPVTGAAGQICLTKLGGQLNAYYIEAGVLKRAENCGGPPWTNPVEITSDVVRVVRFDPVVETSGPNIVKQQVKLTLRVASGNGTASAAGVCNDNSRDRTFCSSVTLTSGAVPR